MVCLAGSGKSLRICLAVHTEYRRVTNGQTDEWTDRHLATCSILPSRLVGLPDGAKALRICVTGYTQYCVLQTDGQTDGQTSCYSILCAMHTRRAVKITLF